MILLSFKSFSQEDFKDTIWLSKYHGKSEKAEASFYIVYKKVESQYVIYEKDLSGDIKMISEASALDPLILDGYTTYYEKGVRTSRGYRKKGNKTGVWTNYYENDSSLYRVNPNGTADYIRRSVLQNDEIFSIVELTAEFPGGLTAMMKFIADNTKYPANSKKIGLGGKVLLKFFINEEGFPKNIEVVKSSGVEELDIEAVRVVSSMPKWKPATMSERPVKCYFNLPFTFADNEKPYFVFNVNNKNENYMQAKNAVLDNDLQTALNFYYKDIGDIDAWYNIGVIQYLKKEKSEAKRYFENVVMNSKSSDDLNKISQKILTKHF